MMLLLLVLAWMVVIFVVGRTPAVYRWGQENTAAYYAILVTASVVFGLVLGILGV